MHAHVYKAAEQVVSEQIYLTIIWFISDLPKSVFKYIDLGPRTAWIQFVYATTSDETFYRGKTRST